MHREKIQQATTLEKWPSTEIPNNIRHTTLLSIVNHRHRHAPEVSPVLPQDRRVLLHLTARQILMFPNYGKSRFKTFP